MKYYLTPTGKDFLDEAEGKGLLGAKKPGFFRRNSMDAQEAKDARKLGPKGRKGTMLARTPKGNAARQKEKMRIHNAALAASDTGDDNV